MMANTTVLRNLSQILLLLLNNKDSIKVYQYSGFQNRVEQMTNIISQNIPETQTFLVMIYISLLILKTTINHIEYVIVTWIDIELKL